MSSSFMSLSPAKPPNPAGRNGPVPALGHIRETLPIPFILQQPEEQTDNWDDDFEEGISLAKLQGMLTGYIIYLPK
jgi:hypothetical protein